MNTRQISICLVSNNEERLSKYLNLLADPTNKITAGTFERAFHEIFIEENPDLLILDVTSYANFDYRIIEPLRSQKKYTNLPFLFLISDSQTHLIQQLYKVPHNRVLIEPVNKYLLISEINNSIHLSGLERRVNLYKDIVDGEKKLISYMDELLELSRITEFKTKVELLNYLQTGFVKKLELSLAVEMCVVGIYNDKNHTFNIQIYGQNGKDSSRKLSISIVNSKINDLLKNNYPLIFENELLSDSFVQELEELLGYKISGMLVTPLVLLHQPVACFILVNKLYRNDFSENDLAFTTIAAQKIVYHLEMLEILGSDNPNLLLQKTPLGQTAKSSLFLEKALSAVDFGMVVFDTDLKIHSQNPASKKILRSTSTPGTLPEMFVPNAFESIKNSIDQGEFPVIRREIHLHLSKKTDFYLGYSIYTMEWDFDKLYYIMVFSEISQTKRIQAEIIRMDRMASLGILSSGIAHEIRNPLAGIKAMAENMEEELPKGSHTLEYVSRILRQVDRLDALLRSFFSYAKPTRPDPKVIHIKYIVDEALALFTRKLREKNLKVSQYYAKDLAHVFVDANQIQQVLINIILNSIQAMDTNGELNISADNARTQMPTIDRRKRSRELLSDKFIEILISDTGSGFDDHLKDQIFNPFFTTKSAGTGLGLAIVYQIVREHGGQINVESQPGKGTTFKILLPAMEKSADSGLIS